MKKELTSTSATTQERQNVQQPDVDDESKTRKEKKSFKTSDAMQFTPSSSNSSAW